MSVGLTVTVFPNTKSEVNRLATLLSSDEFFVADDNTLRDLGVSNCPVSVEDRRRVAGSCRDWSVFVTLAKALTDPAVGDEDCIRSLREIAGFDPLKSVLQQRFINFVQNAPGDVAVKAELMRFIELTHGVGAQRFEGASAAATKSDRELSRLLHLVELDYGDMDALERVAELDGTDALSAEEADELRRVFGRYGLDVAARLPAEADRAYAGSRQQAWSSAAEEAINEDRRSIARQSVDRYGWMLREMSLPGTTMTS